MKQKFRYGVLSPDGFTIEREVKTYPTMNKAKTAFNKWKERFVSQGYYSYRGMRIDIDQLEYHCSFIPVPVKHKTK